jgi:hypothetical protein
MRVVAAQVCYLNIAAHDGDLHVTMVDNVPGRVMNIWLICEGKALSYISLAWL